MKKILTLLLVMVLTVGMLSMTAYAADGGALSISSATVDRGNNVSVSVNITSNPGFSYALLSVSFDESALQLNSIDPASGWVVFGKNAQFNSMSGDSTQTGTVLTLNFTVLDTAAKGSYAISVSPEANNWDEEDVAFAVSAGSITVTIPPCAVHTYGALTGTEPTCTEAGVKTQTCSVCGDVNTVTTPATGHKEGTWTVKTEATCAAEGLKVLPCTVCGMELKTETIAALPHTPAEGKGTYNPAPTCDKDGLFEGECAACGAVLAPTTVPALGHNYVEDPSKYVAPTCELAGKKVLVCQNNCGKDKEEAVAPIGHKYPETGNVVEDSTCTKVGKMEFVCGNNCGIKKYEDIPMKDHQLDGVRVEPTCTEPGKESGKCKVCGQEFDEKVIAPLGHEWVEQTDKYVAPTCDENGKKFFECSRCDETKEEIVPALGHTPGAWDTDDGVTATGKCTVCGIAIEHKHDYRHETGKVVNGKAEILCGCGVATYKELPANSADLDDVPKTGDISTQIVATAACGLAALMAVAFVFKRKAA